MPSASNAEPNSRDAAGRGVTATVSAVINETNYVSPPLKERVLEAIAQLSYAPSGVARSFSR